MQWPPSPRAGRGQALATWEVAPQAGPAPRVAAPPLVRHARTPARTHARTHARPPTLRHVQLKVAGRELIQALLELGSAGRLHCGLWSLMGETEQESPRMCVEAPWSDHGFCLEPCAAAPDSSLQGMLLCRGAPQAGSNLIGARGPLASAVGLMLQGNQVTTSPRSQTCPLLPSNPTQQSKLKDGPPQTSTLLGSWKGGLRWLAEHSSEWHRGAQGTKPAPGGPGHPLCTAAVRKSGKDGETLKS